MMINVDLGDGVIQQMDDSLFDRRAGFDEDERAKISWVEYWQTDKLVHRSAHIELKQGLSLAGDTGVIGG